jgi:hypothetical protein
MLNSIDPSFYFVTTILILYYTIYSSEFSKDKEYIYNSVMEIWKYKNISS